LSAGRVQTVAVKIICERERAIEAFAPQEYWSITADFLKDAKKLAADLYRINKKKFKINNEKEVKKILNDIKNNDFIVNKIKTRKKKRNPQAPFITSTLQQRASSYLGFTTKKTMFIAQQLYEGVDLDEMGTVGLISYIRTDSTRISKEASDAANNYIVNSYGEKYLSQKKKKYKNKNTAQDAHEAIRPTYVDITPEKAKKHLSNAQYKLYELIWKRFIASQMSHALYEYLTVTINAGKKYIFRLSTSKVLFSGYQELWGKDEKKEVFPSLKEGEKLLLADLKPEQHFTQAPPRFTEASLVKTLEEDGIGRPSTYSPTISTIVSRGYVEKAGKSLKPTELGFVVNDLLTDFFPEVTDIEFTAQMEERFDKIEAGKEDWKKLLSEFYNPFSDRLEKAQDNMKRVEIVEETDEVCDKCGRPMVVKYGRYGKFLACSGYPECKSTKPFVIKTGVKCPECKTGELIERKSKKGRKFYGCSNYPDCNFMVWNKPVKKKCPECGGLMVEKNSQKKGKYYKCINKECAYEKNVDK